MASTATATAAAIGRLGARTFWGGYLGTFMDPDRHAWGMVHKPGWVPGGRRQRAPTRLRPAHTTGQPTASAGVVTCCTVG